MKIAVFGDIHGNVDALEAVLKDIAVRSIQTIYNLGDSLYGPLFPLETFQLLQQYNIHSISGNCDRLLLDRASTNSTVRYVQKQLGEEHRLWLSSLPSMLETEDCYFCHGTPTSDETYLLETMGAEGSVLKHMEDILKEVKSIQQKLIFCAHTHISRVVYLPTEQIIINPGSVGLPAYEDELPIRHKMESGSPFAQYTIVEKNDDDWKIEHIQIPYNKDRAIATSKTNNRLDWTIALETGRMS